MRDEWQIALAERATHEITCAQCLPYGGPRCPEGQRLADAEQTAYHALFQSRFIGGAATPTEVTSP